jgi:hypothetical protein
MVDFWKYRERNCSGPFKVASSAVSYDVVTATSKQMKLSQMNSIILQALTTTWLDKYAMTIKGSCQRRRTEGNISETCCPLIADENKLATLNFPEIKLQKLETLVMYSQQNVVKMRPIFSPHICLGRRHSVVNRVTILRAERPRNFGSTLSWNASRPFAGRTKPETRSPGVKRPGA